MAKRQKEFIEVIEEYRGWPYGDSVEPYRFMMERPKPPKKVVKKDPYSALTSRKRTSKTEGKKHDKHSSQQG